MNPLCQLVYYLSIIFFANQLIQRSWSGGSRPGDPNWCVIIVLINSRNHARQVPTAVPTCEPTLLILFSWEKLLFFIVSDQTRGVMRFPFLIATTEYFLLFFIVTYCNLMNSVYNIQIVINYLRRYYERFDTRTMWEGSKTHFL